MLPKFKTILFASGLGAGDPYVFRCALSLAQQYDARIRIVHGHEPMRIKIHNKHDAYTMMDTTEEEANRKIEADIMANLEDLCSRELGDDPQGRQRVEDIAIVRLPPKQAILEEAVQHNVDLIVMGSHRHSVLVDAMLGTTTLKVLHSSIVPVFVVKVPENLDEKSD